MIKRLAVAGALAALCLTAAGTAAAASTRAADDCRPALLVFYAQSDWLRLAQKLAAHASPCAQYEISVPPLAGDKTQPRPNQAWQIRALGPNFHPLAEANYTGWSRWVAATGQSWYQAGVQFRAKMAAAGYDVAQGDGWAMNELSSAVRRNAGQARQNALDFLRGLYDAGGAAPAAKGVVFDIGVSQTDAPDLSAYRANWEDWLQDSAFWSTLAQYVSVFSQEDYGDLRAYAVAGSAPADRRAHTADYLGAGLTLANVGPDTAAAARAFLQTAFSPLANGAWAWGSAYGWTQDSSGAMADYVSGQTWAARWLGSTWGGPVDRFGFAWAPANSEGLAPGDFAAQTGAILDRLAAAIHDSAEPSSDPGSLACGGDLSICTSTVAGAAFTDAWSAFSSWSPTTVAFSSAPFSTAAGAPATVTLQVTTAGQPDTTVVPLTVTLASDSPTGRFAASPTDPSSPTLTLTIPAGASTASFAYLDTAGGSPTISATAGGQVATQTESIAAPPPAPAPAPQPVAPPKLQAHVRTLSTALVHGRLHVTAALVDRRTGNPLAHGRIKLVLRRGTRTVAATVARTSARGRIVWAAPKVLSGCYTAAVVGVSAAGADWDGLAKTSRYCRAARR